MRRNGGHPSCTAFASGGVRGDMRSPRWIWRVTGLFQRRSRTSQRKPFPHDWRCLSDPPHQSYASPVVPPPDTGSSGGVAIPTHRGLLERDRHALALSHQVSPTTPRRRAFTMSSQPCSPVTHRLHRAPPLPSRSHPPSRSSATCIASICRRGWTPCHLRLASRRLSVRPEAFDLKRCPPLGRSIPALCMECSSEAPDEPYGSAVLDRISTDRLAL